MKLKIFANYAVKRDFSIDINLASALAGVN